MAYTLAEIAAIIQVSTPVGECAQYIRTLLTDSRKLLYPSETLFFAINGPQRNAHAFIGSLYERGVRAFVVDESFLNFSKYPEGIFLVCPNPLVALQQLAAYHRKQFKLPVIGITGSNGKTIVKEWISQLLGSRFSIVKSPKSYNSQVGVPLSIWQLSESYNLGVFEAGISTTGEMEQLQKIILPQIGVFTSLGSAHASGFLNIEEKAKEKLKLFSLSHSLVYPYDNEILRKEVGLFIKEINPSLKSYTWGHTSGADIVVTAVQRKERSTHIQCTIKERPYSFIIPFTDDASVQNALTCCALLLALDLNPSEFSEQFQQLRSVEMRLQMKQGINQCAVVNDSYSADLQSLSIALQFLEQQKHHHLRTLILSDMPEQGMPTSEMYARIGSMLQNAGVNRFIGIGAEVSAHAMYFKDIIRTSFYESTDAFIENLAAENFRDEIILLKGARRFEFERISYFLELKTHDAILEIDLAAVRHNLKYFIKRLSPGVKLMAMVKAFSYGTGSYEIASILENNGVDYLAVAYPDEGVELRKAGIRLPIMVMNPERAGFHNIVHYELEPELYSFGLLNDFITYLQRRGITRYPVHIKLDTGMHRLGFESGDIHELAALLRDNAEIKAVSVFSHLAASGNKDLDDFTAKQASTFELMAAEIKNEVTYPFFKHLLNSSGIIRHHHLQYDMVRLGIGLYGVDEDEKILAALQPVATLRTTISQVRIVKSGDSVGYNRAGKVTKDAVIATVRIGYADGYSRSLGNGVGAMLVGGKMAPVIGNVCMDMTMLDITGIDAREGDDVVVFGAMPTVASVAAKAGTIAYEMLTGVSQRVKRVYFNE